MLNPIGRGAWTAATAAHLAQRAGFGGTPAEIAQLTDMTPTEAVASLVDFDSKTDETVPPGWVLADGADARPMLKELRRLPEAERRKRLDAMRMEQREQMAELRRWWVARMVGTRCPLQEKLTLFWHGHFASGIRKVRSPYAMYRQNETYRHHAAGNWRALVKAAVREPAMLIYLDNAQSHAKAPNENLARELMELFTLGEGRYGEEDVKAAARALTGWSIARDRMVFELRPRMHDDGEKTFLGKRGRLGGDEIVAIILDQAEAPAFIARKIWRYFVAEDPDAALVQALGATLRRHDYELRPLLRTMFLSEEFYAAGVRGTQIKSPVQWLVGALRGLELEPPPGPRTALILRQLGQDLFDPPNVKGWDGGFSWITAANLALRFNLTPTLVQGFPGKDRPGRRKPALDGARILPAEARQSVVAAQEALEWRVFQGDVDSEVGQAIGKYLAALGDPKGWSDAEVAEIVAFMMATPQYQLC